jgi:hypothetical protein
VHLFFAIPRSWSNGCPLFGFSTSAGFVHLPVSVCALLQSIVRMQIGRPLPILEKSQLKETATLPAMLKISNPEFCVAKKHSEAAVCVPLSCVGSILYGYDYHVINFHLVCARLSPPPALFLSLSPHRHPFSRSFLCIPPSSRFIRYNKTTSTGHCSVLGSAKKFRSAQNFAEPRKFRCHHTHSAHPLYVHSDQRYASRVYKRSWQSFLCRYFLDSGMPFLQSRKPSTTTWRFRFSVDWICLDMSAERICDITYPISSSPYYSEDIHTKITMVLLKGVLTQG